MVRPSTECSPISLMCSSVMDPLPLPEPSVLKFPRSPTWRVESVGALWGVNWDSFEVLKFEGGVGVG